MRRQEDKRTRKQEDKKTSKQADEAIVVVALQVLRGFYLQLIAYLLPFVVL